MTLSHSLLRLGTGCRRTPSTSTAATEASCALTVIPRQCEHPGAGTTVVDDAVAEEKTMGTGRTDGEDRLTMVTASCLKMVGERLGDSLGIVSSLWVQNSQTCILKRKQQSHPGSGIPEQRRRAATDLETCLGHQEFEMVSQDCHCVH